MTSAAEGETSDERFEAVMAALKAPRKAPAPNETIKTRAGEPLAEVKKTASKTTIALPAKTSDGFDDWLIANLADIHRDWVNSSGE